MPLSWAMLPTAPSTLPCIGCAGWVAEDGRRLLIVELGAGLSLKTVGLVEEALVVKPTSLLLLLTLEC